jgi:hypothetical protein
MSKGKFGWPEDMPAADRPTLCWIGDGDIKYEMAFGYTEGVEPSIALFRGDVDQVVAIIPKDILTLALQGWADEEIGIVADCNCVKIGYCPYCHESGQSN